MVAVGAPCWCRRCGRCAVRGVMGAVVVMWWCHGCGRCAVCGVAVAVVAPHVVSWMLLPCRGGVAVAVGIFCAVCGLGSGSSHRVGVALALTVFACVVSQSCSLRRMWCHGRGRCAACGSGSGSSHHVSVVVTLVARRMVSRPRSLRRAWVALAIFARHVVSPSPSSRRVVLQSWWPSSCRVVPVPQLRSSSSCRHWTTKEEVSRKKKENVLAGRCGVCSCEGHGDAMHAGAGRGRRVVPRMLIANQPQSH
jgi:hypothetical protein